jgi:hypothetical protein
LHFNFARACLSLPPGESAQGLPPAVLFKMERTDLAWERFYDMSSQELGELIRMPKMGRCGPAFCTSLVSVYVGMCIT